MGQSIKPEGWEKRLNDLITEKARKPFSWGIHDCTLFAIDCADAQLGTEIAKEFRGKYRSAKGGYAILEEMGGFKKAFESYGFKAKPIEQARRGDLAFIGGDLAMGVVMGDRIIATGLNGLKSVSITKALYVLELPCHQ